MSNQMVQSKAPPPPYRESARPSPTHPPPVQQIVQQQPPPASGLEEEPLKQKTQIVYVKEIQSTQNVNVTEGAAEQQPLTQQYVVDSSGQRITMPPTVQSTANVTYVDQYGRPVPAPTQQQIPQPVPVPDQQDKETQTNRKAQIGVCIIAGIGVLLIFIGLCVDNLARYEVQNGLELICGWTGVKIECDDTIYTNCDYVEEEFEFEWSEACTSAGETQIYCDTEAAALIALVTMILAVISAIIGVALIQPWTKITKCFAEDNKYVWSARVYFVVSIFFSILSIILWTAIDDYCTEHDDVELGGSQICNIVGMIFIVIALIIMFANKI